MDLYTLDSTYHLKDLIEGYSSLTWAERFTPCGEFVLKTPYIAETMAAVPLDTLLSLGDSREVMIAETMIITNDDDGKTTLELRGRSFESFYENRAAISVGQLTAGIQWADGTQKTWDINGLTSAQTATSMIHDHCYTGILDAKDAIPNFSDSIQINRTLEINDRKIERGNLYERVLELLNEDVCGIRQERPATAASNTLFSIVYDGTDKSSTVTFDVAAGQLDDARYLLTTQGTGNGVYAACKNAGYAIFLRLSPAVNYTGLQRKMKLFDAPDLVSPNTPTGHFLELESRAYSAINKQRPRANLDGTVSAISPYKYGRGAGFDYYLGDVVMGVGEYGVRQKLMVTEYVRVQDENGEIGIPTLSA